MKKTIAQKLNERHVKRPTKFSWTMFKVVAKLAFHPNFTKIEAHWAKDFSKEKGPYIFISNHASRLDIIFNGYYLKERLNIMVGYNEFYRSHLRPLFDFVGCIPKRNFTPDFHAMREAVNIAKNGGSIGIFVEGMNSIGGMSQPVAPGTANFLKKMKLPVYYSVIRGGFLCQPKYNLTDRKGPVEVYFDQMFTTDELDKLSLEEIEDKLNLKLYNDDYAWNKVRGYEYKIKKGAGIADGLENLLYYCPKCHSELTMETNGDIIKCNKCGNGATINTKYDLIPFDDSCVIPETQSIWFNIERDRMKELVKDPNFSLEEHVKLGNLPEYKMLKNASQTSLIVGEGMLHLDKTGLTYTGTRNNEEFTFHISLDSLPTYGMCTDLSRFYTFYNLEFMEFYPDHKCTEKWFMATEELHRLYVGKWKDYKFDKNEMAKKIFE